MSPIRFGALAAVLALPFTAGCIELAVSGASSGVGYTVSNVAYRTFTFPKKEVQEASLRAFEKMKIEFLEKREISGGAELRGKTKKLKIIIQLFPVTPNLTKIGVNARRNLVMKDKAVSIEIINQVALALETQ